MTNVDADDRPGPPALSQQPRREFALTDRGFVAKCSCGWKSSPVPTIGPGHISCPACVRDKMYPEAHSAD